MQLITKAVISAIRSLGRSPNTLPSNRLTLEERKGLVAVAVFVLEVPGTSLAPPAHAASSTTCLTPCSYHGLGHQGRIRLAKSCRISQTEPRISTSP